VSNDADAPHIRLFLPGPTEVRREVLDAQARWMIGHRMPEAALLVARIRPRLQQVFQTEARVLISSSSGTGLWEAASRNGVRQRVLHCVNGAFAERWADVSERNGKAVLRVESAWGQPVDAGAVARALEGGGFDAVAFVHNESSTGVLSPLDDVAAAVRAAPGGDDILIMVDAVSSLAGADVPCDALDLDIVLTSSQKAFALPPGLAFAMVSARAMARAASVPGRGYYFDFLELARYLDQDQTPATPALSLLAALDVQLDAMLTEGMAARFARHAAMRDVVLGWARGHGFAPFAAFGAESPTVSCLVSGDRLDVGALNRFLRARGMILSGGYGPLKGTTFRIGHMGDWQVADIQELLGAVDAYLVEARAGATATA